MVTTTLDRRTDGTNPVAVPVPVLVPAPAPTAHGVAVAPRAGETDAAADRGRNTAPNALAGIWGEKL